MRQLPHLAEMAENTPGLHVVGLYAQVQPLPDIEKVLSKNNVKFPVAMDTFATVGYLAPALPKVWIVGVEGKVIFVGKEGYDDVLKKELAKVKYPGLGRDKVSKELEPAAKAFGEGKYGEAYKLAEKISDDSDDDTALDDAEYIMDRIDDRLGTLVERADTAEIEKHYSLAIACLQEIATKYAGMEDAQDAPERLKKMQDSKEVTAEITAHHDLLAVMMALDTDFQDKDENDAEVVRKFRLGCIEKYKKFVAEHANTGAADEAKGYINLLTELTKPADKPKDKPKDDKPKEK